MYDSIHAQLYAWMDWWMNACMHKCMYGCMHAWMHVGMYVCIYWYMHVWVCSYICMCVLFLYGQFAYSIADYFVGWCTWLDSKCHQKPCSHLRSYDELLRRSGLVSGCYHLSSGMFNTYLKNNHLWTDPCDIEGYRCLPKTPPNTWRKLKKTNFNDLHMIQQSYGRSALDSMINQRNKRRHCLEDDIHLLLCNTPSKQNPP